MSLIRYQPLEPMAWPSLERWSNLRDDLNSCITLPTRVDANKISATYRDGILAVTLPKAEEAKPKQIQVTVN